MNTSKENMSGWAGSLTFHALLFALFFFLKVPEFFQEEEIVEVSWGSAASVVQAAPAADPSKASALDQSSALALQRSEPSQVVTPPERRIPDPTDDVIRLPKTEKITSLESNTNSQRKPDTYSGEKSTEGQRSMGQKETNATGGLGRDEGATAPSAGLHAGPSAIDRGVSFNIQWLDGSTRRKISGDLPKYPQGVNVEAQIKVIAVIQPDGTVKTLQPAQKGNQKLEDAAVKEVRIWRFEALRASQPQVEQRCEVTFLFTLK
jgi:outer membrane biosynthesis protein TonB